MAVSKRDAERLRKAARAVIRRQAAEEAKLRREVLPGWRRVRAELGREAEALAKKIAAAEGEPKESWLHKQERYQKLLDQVELRVAELTKAADLPVTAFQTSVLEAAAAQARTLTTVALAPAGAAAKDVMAQWTNLPVADVEAMIGRTSKGTPLDGLLREIAPDARAQAAQVLTQGITVGKNPRVVARELQNVSDAASSRLLTIARTETLNAGREATLEGYRLNSGIVQGWVWTASLDENTCEACIALCGETFPVQEECDCHPNCRCCMVPETMSWEDLGLGEMGLGETSVAGLMETGPEWFDKQSADLQRSILGPGKLDALQSGVIDWPDLIAHTHNPDWGGMRRAASLREAKASAARR